MIIEARLTMRYADIGDELKPTDDFRGHLGASTIGRECAREIWYSWRWFSFETYDARMRRLFQRGHREEPIVVDALREASITVATHDDNGKQFRFIGYKGHEGGSTDGFVYNVPDTSPGTWGILECKTHNEKSFKATFEMDGKTGANIGLQKYKPEHYGQCQRYAKAWNLPFSLYVGVNKNTDERKMLIVPFVEEHAKQMEDRAKLIIDSDQPPRRISESETFFKCSWCKHKAVCHRDEAPRMSCRSCVYAKPVEAGEWQCTNPNHPVLLSREMQHAGCTNYVAIK